MSGDLVPIGDLVRPISTWSPATSATDSTFAYLDLGSVDQARKEILKAAPLPVLEAPSRARQLVEAGDVLVSTVRPNLNGVAEVPPDLDGATASTAFCVLRPGPGLNNRYLYHWVRSTSFVADMVRKATGASYPAISDRIVKASLIPLPRVAEQRRIAEVLDRVDALSVKRLESLVVLTDLMKALFIDMFGDPAVNNRDWPVVELAEIAEQVTDGEHQTPVRSPTGVKLLSARNVRQGKLDFGDVDHVPHAEYERIRRRCDPLRGDILISCSGTIGRVALVNVDEPLALVRSVALVRPKRGDVTADYLAYYLRSAVMQRRMNSLARASSQANLFQGPIRGLPVLLPPLRLQRLFSDSVGRMMMTQDQLGSHGSMIDSLFISLQQRAFSGQL